MKKNIIIVGDIASIHVYNYVKNVILHLDCDCTLYNFSKNVVQPYVDFYNECGIKIIQGISTEVYKNKGALTFTKEMAKCLNEIGPFDILHVHQIRPSICPALYIVRKLYKKIVLTYWGSDVYRISNLRSISTMPLLSVADQVTMMTQDMLEAYKKKWVHYFYCPDKVEVLDFGNMFYNRIAHFSKDVIGAKKDLGLNEKKYVCTIGYVGRPQMQQEKTIKSIVSNGKKLSDVLQIVIPAYGMDDKAYENINVILRDSGFEYVIFRDFMMEIKVSLLRAATDIFIHSQTTDALSCAMLEHLYAGSVVLNGSWLKYSSLDKNAIYYKSFDVLEKLPELLSETIEHFDDEHNYCKGNR